MLYLISSWTASSTYPQACHANTYDTGSYSTATRLTDSIWRSPAHFGKTTRGVYRHPWVSITAHLSQPHITDLKMEESICQHSELGTVQFCPINLIVTVIINLIWYFRKTYCASQIDIQWQVGKHSGKGWTCSWLIQRQPEEDMSTLFSSSSSLQLWRFMHTELWVLFKKKKKEKVLPYPQNNKQTSKTYVTKTTQILFQVSLCNTTAESSSNAKGIIHKALYHKTKQARGGKHKKFTLCTAQEDRPLPSL